MTAPRSHRSRLGRALTAASGGLAAALVAVACAPPPSTATVLARMTEAQRVGQLFMVGSPASGTTLSTVGAIVNNHVGSVILTGRSAAGVTATRSGDDALQRLVSPSRSSGVPLMIATDQEGGFVQVLSGPGFSAIPTGLAQGGEAVASLQGQAQAWGAQLSAAGVQLDLAPVLDTVPPGTAAFQPADRSVPA